MATVYTIIVVLRISIVIRTINIYGGHKHRSMADMVD